MTRREIVRSLVLLVSIGVALLASSAWVFQDTITRALINPKRSYEAYTPPPPPDYARADAWLARGDGAGPADIFFIHNNIYRGDGRWNAPHDRETQLAFLRDTLLPLEAGPFAAYGQLWAPRYRQPTFYARFTQKQPGAASRDTALADIERAFDAFLAERDPEKPFFLVGYGDGALFAGRLLESRIAREPALISRLAATYAIGMPLPEPMFANEACRTADDARCLIAFTPVDARFEAYQARLRERTLTLRPGAGYVSSSRVDLACIPPPLGRTITARRADPPESFEIELDGACTDGLFIFAPPEERRLRQMRFFGRHWLPDTINLFAGALADDAGRRLNALVRLLAIEANTAPPMMEAEDIGDAPIKTVPKESDL